MASPTQWTWVWVNSWSWRWTGRPGMLQSMGSQRVGYDWETELNWTLQFLPSVILPHIRDLKNWDFEWITHIRSKAVEMGQKRNFLLLGRKAVTNLDSILKSRDITLQTKVHIGKGMVFPVVMYGCERWTIKKAECQRIDAFELWCWRRLLRVTWTARRSNQSILKEISPEYLLEGLMLKLKLQYFGYLMQRGDSLGKKKKKKTLML